MNSLIQEETICNLKDELQATAENLGVSEDNMKKINKGNKEKNKYIHDLKKEHSKKKKRA